MSRVIHEDAVKALLQIKIDALEARIEKMKPHNTPSSNIMIGNYQTAIGAMRVMQSHLKFCPDASADLHNAGGVFPIAEASEIVI